MIEDVLGIQDAAMGLEKEKSDSCPPPPKKGINCLSLSIFFNSFSRILSVDIN